MSGNLSQKNKSLCSHKNLYTDVHSWNQPQCPSGQLWANSCGMASLEHALEVKHTVAWMDPTGTIPKGYIHIQKVMLIYGSTYITFEMKEF